METTTAMQGLWDLLDSERGVAFLALLIAATILSALHIISPADWIAFAKWLAALIIGSKTVTSAIESYRRPPNSSTPAPQIAPASSAPPAPTPPPAT